MIDLTLIAKKVSDGTFYNMKNDKSQYDFVKKQYSFGTRIVAIPKTKQLIEDLQTSRGPQCVNETIKTHDMDKLVEKFSVGTFEQHIERMNPILEKCNVRNNYYEIGFRTPHSLQVAQKHFKNVSGSDIISITIECAKYMGFNVFQHDLMCDDPLPIGESPDVIVAYHVLEHLYCPEKGLKKMRNAVNANAIMQVEVPIQPGEPSVRFAHLFAFENNDLCHMINECGGWEILIATKQEGIERYLCKAI
jgi:hypothetical protein